MKCLSILMYMYYLQILRTHLTLDYTLRNIQHKFPSPTLYLRVYGCNLDLRTYVNCEALVVFSGGLNAIALPVILA